MALVTSKSTTWPSATAPTVESTGPSIAGCVLAVTVLSSHEQLVTEWMRPPATLWECDTFDTCSRRRADVTWRAPTPLTRTRKNACLTGLPSTSSRALGPLLLAGVAAFTMASASTTPTAARGDGGQVQSVRQAPAHEALSAPSHCSFAWSTTLSPQRGDAAVGAAAVGAAAVGAAAVGAAAGGARCGDLHEGVGGRSRAVVGDVCGVTGVAVRDEELRVVKGRALEAHPVVGQRLQEGDDVRPAIRLPDEAADTVDLGVEVGG